MYTESDLQSIPTNSIFNGMLIALEGDMNTIEYQKDYIKSVLTNDKYKIIFIDIPHEPICEDLDGFQSAVTYICQILKKASEIENFISAGYIVVVSRYVGYSYYKYGPRSVNMKEMTFVLHMKSFISELSGLSYGKLSLRKPDCTIYYAPKRNFPVIEDEILALYPSYTHNQDNDDRPYSLSAGEISAGIRNWSIISLIENNKYEISEQTIEYIHIYMKKMGNSFKPSYL